MTTSVDVLAVLDKCHDALECGGLRHVLAESISAVAELIDADVAYDNAYANAVCDPANEAALAEADERRAAALARIKGA